MSCTDWIDTIERLTSIAAVSLSSSSSEDGLRTWIEEIERIILTSPSSTSISTSNISTSSLPSDGLTGENYSTLAIQSDLDIGINRAEDSITSGSQVKVPHLIDPRKHQKWRPGDSSSSSESSLSPQPTSDTDSDTYTPPQPSTRRTPSVPPAEAEPVHLKPSELYRNNPIIWSAMAEELDSLMSKRWIGSHILDAWLFLTWTSSARDGSQRSMRFIRTAHLESHTNGEPTPAEVLEFRRQYHDLPKDGPCELEDVAYVHHTGEHYFVILFLPCEGLIYILGQFINAQNAQGTLEGWNGRNIWKTVRAYFGWEPRKMQIRRTDWVQNGYDCGPTSAQVLEWIWENGLRCSEDKKWIYPKDKLPCCHGLRRSMALVTHRLIRAGVEGFSLSMEAHMTQLVNYYGEEAINNYRLIAEGAYENCTAGIDRKVRDVVNNLDLAIANCSMCSSGEDAGYASRRTALGADQKGLVRSPIYPAIAAEKNAGRMGSETMGLEREGGDGLFEDENLLSSVQILFRCETPTNESIYLESRRPTGAIGAQDWSQAVLGRFPRPSGPELPSIASRACLHHAQCIDYDDYTNGPTRDILDPLPPSALGLEGLSLAYIASRIMEVPWTIYKDYGYRLLPTFCQVAYLGKPVMVKDHLCPAGPPYLPPQFEDPGISRLGIPVRVGDLCTVGPREFLDLAEEQGLHIMATGRLNDGRYIRVDLEKEAQTPQQVNAAIDVDSIVWITRNPIFSGPVGLQMSPVIRDRPPLWKNNHIQVELLYPQTVEDKEGQGPRSDWDTRAFPLSRIPHILLATIAQVTSSVEVLLFFPRMTHFHPHTHRWENGVPAYLQKLFWDKLLYPALKEAAPDEQLQFYASDRSHSAFKRGGPGKMSAHPVSSDVFSSLMMRIDQKIKHEFQGTYDYFGSFFFVVQVKGCKGLTQTLGKTPDAALAESLSKFAHSFPSLDWEYMRDRTHGELVCDVGVTIQPSSDVKLVGLWKLDRLEASYGAGGYLSGNLHTLNTLSNYGGLQAPMQDKRRQQTHLIFRSSYNLPYEAIRKHDNSRNLFDEVKVFHRDGSFLVELKQVLDIYEKKAGAKSYGVRDEFRVAGSALKDIEACLSQSVRDLIDHRPMIWLKSSTWFAFLAARLRALDSMHREISRVNPPNIGVLTGIIAYMMQSVLFTPPKVEGFIREALASLQYARHCDVFGMFFLDGYDIKQRSVLPGILQKDDGTVIRHMGPRKSRPNQRHVPPRPIMENEANGLENYPHGANPSMEKITEVLQRDPASIIGPWIWPQKLQRYLDAAEDSLLASAADIFVSFTHIAWYTLAETAPNVENLIDALKAWSLDEVLDKVNNASIRPTFKEASGRGKREIDLRGFATKRSFFFPGVAEPKRAGRWKPLYEFGGYIHYYRRVLTDVGQENAEEFYSYIDELLENCQCLPEVTPGGKRRADLWTRVSHRVLISANPKFLRITAVGPSGRRTGLTRGPAVQRSAFEITKEVLRRSGINEEAAREAMRLQRNGAGQDRRSGRSKNKRKPPTKKAGREGVSSSGDSSG